MPTTTAPNSDTGPPKMVVKSPVSGLQFHAPGRPFEPGSLSSTRIFITGPYRSGKSTLLASGGPRMLVLDFEDKYRVIPHPTCTYTVPRNGRETKELIEWLLGEATAGQRPFDTIGIDTIDSEVYDVMIPWLTSQLPEVWRQKHPTQDITGYGQSERGNTGWSSVTNTTIGLLSQLHLAGYGYVVAGHERGAEDGAKLRPTVNPGVFGRLFGACELYGRTSIVSVTEEGGIKIVKIGTREVKRRERTTRLVVQIHFQHKVPDSPMRLGANLQLPSPLVLPYMGGWDVIQKAWDETVSFLQGQTVEPTAAVVAASTH